jgi:hypothetical protein
LSEVRSHTVDSSPRHSSCRTLVEDRVFSPCRRAEGYRLACKAHVHGDLAGGRE